MKIDLKEIWEFMELVPTPKSSEPDTDWAYQLIAGDITIDGLDSNDILTLKEAKNYNTELLPEIFTFREILWQPNVYPQPQLCIPQLNILKVFCEDYIIENPLDKTETNRLYVELLSGLASYCGEAISKIVSSKEVPISSTLGELRKKAFPIIKFFIFHPLNRSDYQKDSLNRLNYAVKIMLTQYHNKYYDLQDPYWNITLSKSSSTTKASSSSPIEIAEDNPLKEALKSKNLD